MNTHSLRSLLIAAVAAISCSAVQPKASAQYLYDSELDFYAGGWIGFLPDYKAISIVANGGTPVLQRNVFQDSQDDIGFQVGLRGLHRVKTTRTMIEFDVNVASIDGFGSSQTIADPGPASSIWMSNLSGNNRLASPDGTSATFTLDSDVIHYSEFIGLRDRFLNTGVGPVNLGLGFSHMGFEQDYSLIGVPLNGGLSGQYIEDLDTHYFGAEIRATNYRHFRQLPYRLDLNIGVYDMNANYEGVSLFRNAVGVVLDNSQVFDEIHRTAATVTAGLRFDTCFRGVLIRPGINFKYISHMASIRHPQANIVPSSPASLRTKPGYLLGLNLEILLGGRCRCCY